MSGDQNFPKMTVPSLIVIGGMCGSGKSTVGLELAQRIGYQFVDADDFHTAENKARMGRGEPMTDADRVPWLEKLANVWRTSPEGNFIIACSVLKRKYRSVLMGGESNHPGKVVVMLDVPEEVLRKRLEGRVNHFAKSSLIASQLATLEMPKGEREMEEKPWLKVVDGTGTPNEIVEKILREIQIK